MSLHDIPLKGYYTYLKDELLFDFYIPTLSESISYKRIAGYFSSNCLAIAAQGIAKFIDNGGKIKLIANVVLSEKDQEIIKKAIQEKEIGILEEINNLKDALKKDHLKMLGWLIKTSRLEIKIAVVPKGLEHRKKGIFRDSNGNTVTFSGSGNETLKGWLENDEEFHVYCSWLDGDRERHLEPDIQSFDELWNLNYHEKIKVYTISDAFKNGLIKVAPKDAEEFKTLTEDATKKLLDIIKNKKSKSGKEVKLRDYQNEAIKNWINHDKKGIFEMATGTGKTFTALGCFKEVIKSIDSMILVIACPQSHLVSQWAEDLKEFDITFDAIIADSSNPYWKDELMDSVYDINNKVTNYIIILTTFVTLSSDNFRSTINKSHKPLFLIADEVHGIGAPQMKRGLLPKYELRLGLSATPKRWLDEEGTEEIFAFFGDTVFEFSLKKAINTINPLTGKTYLVPYEYKPRFIQLTEEEISKYLWESKKIARAYHLSKSSVEKKEWFSLLCIKRQKIVINAINKYLTLEEILKELKQINDCLVYCSPQQINRVQDLLNQHEPKIIQHKFTNKENTKPDKKYGNISERQYILERFAANEYNILVAMKCLDEGVDIPSAKTAIILASSGNSREYIQRRGRILRPDEGKKKATIYDILVLMPLSKLGDPQIIEIEKKIMEKEFRRYKEFMDSATNSLECLNLVHKIEEEISYG